MCKRVSTNYHTPCFGLVLKKQVMRGHNIVADRWAGASNPYPHPIPLTDTQTYKKSHPRIAHGQRYPMPCLERLAEEVE